VPWRLAELDFRYEPKQQKRYNLKDKYKSLNCEECYEGKEKFVS
jgi:hypothetical protein